MTDLLISEIRRQWSRRTLRSLTVVTCLALSGIAAIVFFNSYPDRPDHFRYEDLDDIFLVLSAPLSILCLAIGASAIGAEWQKGTVPTLLTWEPRRARLLGTRFLAVALVTFLFDIVILGFMAAAMWPVAALRGSIGGLDAAWMLELVETAARIGLVGVLAGTLGCSIAAIGRHTAAALGVVFVYFAVIEPLLRGLRPHWQVWLIGDNTAQFLSGMPISERMLTRSSSDILLVLTAYAALSVAAAIVFFKTRDV